MPTANSVFASPRKIFAHYMFNFPLSIDNKPGASDYYNLQYLAKGGESNKFAAQGSYIRTRPLPVTPSAVATYRKTNLEAEIRMAIARGITGFSFDVMSTEQVTDPNSVLNQMLAAAQAVDSRFKILVMPDMTVIKSNQSAFVQIIEAVNKSPAAFRLADGRLGFSAFDAGLESAIFWEQVMTTLSNAGVKVAFVPTLLGWNNYAEAFDPFSYGFAEWGSATPRGSSYLQGDPDITHSQFKKIFVMPTDPQQFRPKNFQFWEASNSGSLRAGWMAAILGQSDWVQMVTWNDYSESSANSPYTDTSLKRTIGTGYYNLNGYYAAWFLTGQVPKIDHDVLYWFYRKEPTNAAAPGQKQVSKIVPGGTPEDTIEVLTFLVAPGQLKITIDGHTTLHDVAAGLRSIKIPTAPGVPTFALVRNNAEVFSFQGGVQIYGKAGLPSGTMDMTYYSGSASSSGVCSL